MFKEAAAAIAAEIHDRVTAELAAQEAALDALQGGLENLIAALNREARASKQPLNQAAAAPSRGD